MKMRRPVQILGLTAGCGGLLASLFLLDGEPLFGVLGMLGAMALLFESLARARETSSTECFCSVDDTHRRMENTDGRER